MTLSNKLLTLGTVKSSIRNALTAHGVPMSGVPFTAYANKIAALSVSGMAPLPTWVRPPEWLALPTLNAASEKIVGLFLVEEDGVNLVIQASGDYQVDWGNGTVSLHAAGSLAISSYDFASLTGPLTAQGAKQAVVSVTAQAGHSLTAFNTTQFEFASTDEKLMNAFVDVSLAGAALASIDVRNGRLEQVRIVKCAVTDFSQFFANCYNLASLPFLDTQAGTVFDGMFTMAISLVQLPVFDTSSGVSFASMFDSCVALRRVPALDTSAGLNFSGMFAYCGNLEVAPMLNTSVGTNFSEMFSNCQSLHLVPDYDTVSGLDFTSMFDTCESLETAPVLDTAQGASLRRMFCYCYALKEVPAYDMSSATTTSLMFAKNFKLLRRPAIVAPVCTDMSAMFLSNQSLSEIELTVPLLPNARTNGMFTNCHSVVRLLMHGMTHTVDCSSLALGRQGLVDFFTSLGTAADASQTLYIAPNPGVSALTEADRSIATAKGWLIVG